MNKTIISIAGLIVVIGAIYYFYINYTPAPQAQADYKTIAYVVEGKELKLEGPAQYFGNEVRTDLDNDGREDIVFLITHSPGGSGTFYYVVAARNTEAGYVGSQAFFLGDRIAPQTTEVSQNPNHQGVVVVNYADRAPSEPMTAQPSVGKSVWLKLDPASMQFGEVVQDFEGEADPSRMTLSMKEWVWQSALYNDGREITPKKPGIFTLTFSTDGKFAAKTDCNSMGGHYSARGSALEFSQIAMTKMFCEGSQESEFTSMLQNTSGYHFTSKGELILDLKFDSGSVVFR